jgi:flagellar hook-associated protein 3 FlgL
MYTAVSDLASQMQLARSNRQTKLALNGAGQEVASGRKSDLLKATGGDLAPLFALDRSLSQLDLRAQTIRDVSARAAASQLNMEHFQGALSGFGADLLGRVNIGDQTGAMHIARAAKGALDTMVSALNARYGGQSLFAGAAVDGPAVVDATTLYADVAALTAAAPDSASAIAAIDSYFFDPAGGFSTHGFTGSAQDAPRAELAKGDVVNYSLRGDDLAIRQALRNVVMVAVAANGDHGGSAIDGMNMLKAAAQGAIDTADALTRLREGLGHVQEHVDAVAAQNAAQASTFRINRNAILKADPYEAATRFKALEGQMQAIYTMTSRLSKLRLQNYLR